VLRYADQRGLEKQVVVSALALVAPMEQLVRYRAGPGAEIAAATDQRGRAIAGEAVEVNVTEHDAHP